MCLILNWNNNTEREIVQYIICIYYIDLLSPSIFISLTPFVIAFIINIRHPRQVQMENVQSGLSGRVSFVLFYTFGPTEGSLNARHSIGKIESNIKYLRHSCIICTYKIFFSIKRILFAL